MLLKSTVTYEGWFPGANFLNLARNWTKDVRDMKRSPFEYASKSLVRPHLCIDQYQSL